VADKEVKVFTVEKFGDGASQKLISGMRAGIQVSVGLTLPALGQSRAQAT
jgi:hypothetical protein